MADVTVERMVEMMVTILDPRKDLLRAVWLAYC